MRLAVDQNMRRKRVATQLMKKMEKVAGCICGA